MAVFLSNKAMWIIESLCNSCVYSTHVNVFFLRERKDVYSFFLLFRYCWRPPWTVGAILLWTISCCWTIPAVSSTATVGVCECEWERGRVLCHEAIFTLCISFTVVVLQLSSAPFSKIICHKPFNVQCSWSSAPPNKGHVRNKVIESILCFFKRQKKSSICYF